jgi:D-arginine dehydrogenase
LYIAREDQRQQLQQLVQDIQHSGGTIAFTEREAALALVPSLRKDYLAEAAQDPDAMDIDVAALHQGFLRLARAAGTRLSTNSPLATVQRRDGLWHLTLSDGDVSAPVLINAAGAWADEVARICGAQPLGFQPLRRTALLVDAPPGVDVRGWPAVIDAEESFYFKPDAGKLLLSPADETPSKAGDVFADDLDIAIAVERVEAALDIEVKRVNHSWAGLRTFSPDRAPVVGFDARVADFFWCAGQGGYGIQSAPAMGRVVAALARRQSLPSDLLREGLHAEDLSPQRFANAQTP